MIDSTPKIPSRFEVKDIKRYIYDRNWKDGETTMGIIT